LSFIDFTVTRFASFQAKNDLSGVVCVENLSDRLDDWWQGRSHKFAKAVKGDMGHGIPTAGFRGRVPVEVWGQSEQKLKTNMDVDSTKNFMKSTKCTHTEINTMKT